METSVYVHSETKPTQEKEQKTDPQRQSLPISWVSFKIFIYFFWERKIERESIEGEAELPVEQSAQPRVQFQDPQIMTPVRGRNLIDGATQVPLQSIF